MLLALVSSRLPVYPLLLCEEQAEKIRRELSSGWIARQVCETVVSRQKTEDVATARTTVLGAFENADVPFHRVVDALKVPRDASRTPVFQALFNMIDHEQDDLNHYPHVFFIHDLVDNLVLKLYRGFWPEQLP